MNGTEKPRDILDRTFDFAVRIVKLCGYLEERRGVCRVLMPQILRAGTSIVSNVEEAQGGQSRADFVAKISIAQKEARETHVRLRMLSAAAVLPREKLSALIDESEELAKVLSAIIISTKKNATRDKSKV